MLRLWKAAFYALAMASTLWFTVAETCGDKVASALFIVLGITAAWLVTLHEDMIKLGKRLKNKN